MAAAAEYQEFIEKCDDGVTANGDQNVVGFCLGAVDRPLQDFTFEDVAIICRYVGLEDTSFLADLIVQIQQGQATLADLIVTCQQKFAQARLEKEMDMSEQEKEIRRQELEVMSEARPALRQKFIEHLSVVGFDNQELAQVEQII